MKVSLIVAVANNGVIGKDNDLIWHLPKDMGFFKETTLGHHVIMGRKTFESLPNPLPNRVNIVVTRNTEYQYEGVIICKSINEALDHCKDDSQTFILGGGEIYSQTINIVDKIELTRIFKDYKGDAYFPEIPIKKFKLVNEETHELEGVENIKYSFLTYIKK
jgi:dihydrofolate reductase